VAVIINEFDLGVVWVKIQEELTRASVLHPTYPVDHLRRTAIMVEEAGEAMKAALEATRPGPGYGPSPGYPPLNNLRDELVQTAAMCIRQLLAMRREEDGFGA